MYNKAAIPGDSFCGSLILNHRGRETAAYKVCQKRIVIWKQQPWVYLRGNVIKLLNLIVCLV